MESISEKSAKTELVSISTFKAHKTPTPNFTSQIAEINRFLSKWYYPAVVGLFGLLCHTMGWEYLFFTAAVLIAVYVCVFNGNSLRLIPLLLTSLIALSRVNNSYVFIQEFNSFVRSSRQLIYVVFLGVVFVTAVLYMFAHKLTGKPSRFWETRVYKPAIEKNAHGQAQPQTAVRRTDNLGSNYASQKNAYGQVLPPIAVRHTDKIQLLRKSKLLIGLLVLCGAYFAAGIFSRELTLRSLGFSLGMTAVLLPVFVILLVTVEWDERSFGFFCDCVTVMLAVIAVQMSIMFYTDPDLSTYLYRDPRTAKGLIFLGWSPSNQIAAVLAVALPFTLYRMVTAKQPIVYFAAALAAVVAIVYTLSRTVVLFAIPMYAAVSIFALVKAKGRKTLWVSYAAAVVGGAVVFAVFREDIMRSLNFFEVTGLGDAGRFEIYRLALEHFTRRPVFGVGFDYLGSQIDRMGFAMYHNYILQFLAAMGLAGLVAYGFHRYQTVKLLIKKFDFVNIFIFGSIAMFVTTSLLDNTLFRPMVMVIYAVVMVMLECHNKTTKKEDNSWRNKCNNNNINKL